MATIRIHTTQNVTLEYEVGSIGDRIVATLIDSLVLVAWAVLWGLIFRSVDSDAGSHEPTDWSSAAGIIAIIIIACIVAPFVFYSLASEIFFNGQSLGKKARHLRVVRLDGTAPRLGDYFLRWLLRLVDLYLPFAGGLVAIITIAVNGKGQRLGDMAAGTTVVSTKAPTSVLPDLGPPLPEDYQPVFPQAADLSDYDVALLHQLLSRSLQHGNYVLLNETANKIKGLLHVQSNMSDEAFLRTVLRDHAHLAATA
ncbi:RDD family protein [Hymenobacter setariae]|uniref:RDD family protein n=1 Tax=Hymenobacter setariae TaxID=2594794 RepID=A0A558BW25_9BACT|nr:RDD family protein [Hymenobacter setariae]TVT40726.1 RDD family protein [Hymenobacter setariae]